jgi:transcriptional regulator with XRE-family HTH domain
MDIKAKREELGLTQTNVAVYCRVSLNAYQNWERGLSTPKPENMAKLKEVLKIKDGD